TGGLIVPAGVELTSDPRGTQLTVGNALHTPIAAGVIVEGGGRFSNFEVNEGYVNDQIVVGVLATCRAQEAPVQIDSIDVSGGQIQNALALDVDGCRAVVRNARLHQVGQTGLIVNAGASGSAVLEQCQSYQNDAGIAVVGGQVVLDQASVHSNRTFGIDVEPTAAAITLELDGGDVSD